MATITKYLVTDSPDDFDGPEFATFKEADANASSTNRCVIEIEYEYSDSSCVKDYRLKEDQS